MERCSPNFIIFRFYSCNRGQRGGEENNSIMSAAETAARRDPITLIRY